MSALRNSNDLVMLLQAQYGLSKTYAGCGSRQFDEVSHFLNPVPPPYPCVSGPNGAGLVQSRPRKADVFGPRRWRRSGAAGRRRKLAAREETAHGRFGGMMHGRFGGMIYLALILSKLS